MSEISYIFSYPTETGMYDVLKYNFKKNKYILSSRLVGEFDGHNLVLEERVVGFLTKLNEGNATFR